MIGADVGNLNLILIDYLTICGGVIMSQRMVNHIKSGHLQRSWKFDDDPPEF